MTGLLNISEAASLGLHTLVMMAHEPEKIWTAGEIAKALRASEAHLYKVLQRLRRAGLTRSTRGPAGGYALGKPGSEISLLEVYEAIDGPIQRNGCLMDNPVCNGTNCVFGDLLEKYNRDIRQHLASMKLAEAEINITGDANESENRKN